MPSVISDTTELSQSRLGKQSPVERAAGNDPFYIELGNKLSATESGSAVQFGRLAAAGAAAAMYTDRAKTMYTPHHESAEPSEQPRYSQLHSLTNSMYICTFNVHLYIERGTGWLA